MLLQIQEPSPTKLQSDAWITKGQQQLPLQQRQPWLMKEKTFF